MERCPACSQQSLRLHPKCCERLERAEHQVKHKTLDLHTDVLYAHPVEYLCGSCGLTFKPGQLYTRCNWCADWHSEGGLFCDMRCALLHELRIKKGRSDDGKTGC